MNGWAGPVCLLYGYEPDVLKLEIQKPNTIFFQILDVRFSDPHSAGKLFYRGL
jgi:hypothetical protein